MKSEKGDSAETTPEAKLIRYPKVNLLWYSMGKCLEQLKSHVITKRDGIWYRFTMCIQIQQTQ